LIAGCISALGYVIYAWHLIAAPRADKTLTPWIIWSLVGALVLKSYLTVGDGKTVDSEWVLVVYALGPPIVLTILLVHRKIRSAPFTLLDKLFLVASAISGIYLWRFDEGVLPLHVNALIDASGGVLLARHVWSSPRSESLAAWTLFGIAGILNLFAVQHWAYLFIVYPLTLATMTVALPLVIAVRRRQEGASCSSRR
jgi:hypothetical protein